jgi:RNA polymerase sigma-70 factor (ECF subfamily)
MELGRRQGRAHGGIRSGSGDGFVTIPDVPDTKDRDLMARVAAADEEAFRELFGRYAATANALAFRVVRQSHLAEEIVQEAFLAVWKKPEGYVANRGSVRSWLMSLVHNRAVDMIRREEALRRRSADAAADPGEPPEDPATQVVAKLGLPEERAAVRGALSDIPAEQRQVIELMYFDGLSQSKIAERLQLPLGTVKSRALLAMRRLRSTLIGMER